MQFLQTVSIKQVLTEIKKDTLTNELYAEQEQLTREIEQFHFQMHKSIKKTDSTSQEYQLRKRYEQEMNKRIEKKKGIEFRLQQLERLPIGSEITSGQAQAIVELNVGDPWPDTEQPLEVVVKDGIIEQFRESRNSDDGMV
ncbi:YlqD family protein [Alkalicoccobacillus gibsonii]|uniref:YlqD family protein n=1 Tax=Alkalicoccobacillus gibsonii TaxID=79881 RepID=UPI003F7B420B